MRRSAQKPHATSRKSTSFWHSLRTISWKRGICWVFILALVCGFLYAVISETLFARSSPTIQRQVSIDITNPVSVLSGLREAGSSIEAAVLLKAKTSVNEILGRVLRGEIRRLVEYIIENPRSQCHSEYLTGHDKCLSLRARISSKSGKSPSVLEAEALTKFRLCEQALNKLLIQCLGSAVVDATQRMKRGVIKANSDERSSTLNRRFDLVRTDDFPILHPCVADYTCKLATAEKKSRKRGGSEQLLAEEDSSVTSKKDSKGEKPLLSLQTWPSADIEELDHECSLLEFHTAENLCQLQHQQHLNDFLEKHTVPNGS